MITLEQIKDDYAVSKGAIDWNDFTFWFDDVDMEKHMDKICELAQKECLKLASEEFIDDNGFGSIYRNLITNENNIIK